MKILKTDYQNFDKKVIISTDNNPNYYFFMPIVSKLWTYMEYNPYIYIFGNTNEWLFDSAKKNIISKTLNAGGNIVLVNDLFLKSDKKLNGYNISMMAQVSRLCPFFLDIDDEDYCLTSDIDMLPLCKNYFKQQDFINKDIHLFYANGYNHTRYAICYIGMKNKIWKKVINKSQNNIYSQIYDLVKTFPSNSNASFQWNFDELLFFNKIKNYKEYPNCCQMIDRQIYKNPGYKKGMIGVPELLPMGRLDRSNWNFNGKINGLVDAHCKRPGYSDINWRDIRYLLSTVLTKPDLEFIDNYYLEFKKFNK